MSYIQDYSLTSPLNQTVFEYSDILGFTYLMALDISAGQMSLMSGIEDRIEVRFRARARANDWFLHETMRQEHPIS